MALKNSDIAAGLGTLGTVGAGVAGGLVGGPAGAIAAASAAGSIATSIYSMTKSQEAAEEAKKAYEQAGATEKAAIEAAVKKLQDNWQTPSYDQSPLSLQEYKVLQDYIPSVAQFAEEKTPQMITEAKSQQEIGLQKEALSRYQQLSTGDDEIAKAQTDLATQQAASALASQRKNILREYASRGLGGTGQELLSQIQASDSQEQQARQEGLQAAIAQRQRQMDALRNMTTLASQVRGQNTQTEQANIDAINQFNQRAAMRKQTYDQYVAGLKNEAQLKNIAAKQTAADANIQQANQQAIANRARQDAIARETAENKNDLLKTTVGLETGSAQTQADRDTKLAQAQAKAKAELYGNVTKAAQSGLGAARDTAKSYYKSGSDTDTQPKESEEFDGSEYQISPEDEIKSKYSNIA
jgi:hypothetical protein